MHYQWHITDACDQRCKHCYIYNENYKKSEMNFDQMKIVLDNIVKYDPEPDFAITGGDPLLNKDFWKLMELLDSYHVTILGNPYHLTNETCKKLKKYEVSVYQVSIDGLEKTHDSIRKPGSFKATIDAIKLLSENKMRPVVMTTISSYNINEVINIIRLCASLKVFRYAFARYCPVGNEKTNGITPLQYKNLLNDVDNELEILAKNGWNNFKKKDHLWLLHDAEKIGAEDAESDIDCIEGCGCGYKHLTICPNGDIMACRRVIGSEVGNIFTDSLKDIWENKMNEYRHIEKFEKCSKCFLGKFCRGCPSVAKGTNGSFYSADPQCWKDV